MNAFIIYDVSTKSKEVKDKLVLMGYWNSWKATSNANIYYLPSNSLWKPDCELAQAKRDITNVIAALNAEDPNHPIILQRCIILSVNPWEGIEGVAVI
ncbi:MAG: hypothetical protein V4557_06470 [Bacteroidota bacterium]